MRSNRLNLNNFYTFFFTIFFSIPLYASARHRLAASTKPIKFVEVVAIDKQFKIPKLVLNASGNFSIAGLDELGDFGDDNLLNHCDEFTKQWLRVHLPPAYQKPALAQWLGLNQKEITAQYESILLMWIVSETMRHGDQATRQKIYDHISKQQALSVEELGGGTRNDDEFWPAPINGAGSPIWLYKRQAENGIPVPAVNRSYPPNKLFHESDYSSMAQVNWTREEFEAADISMVFSDADALDSHYLRAFDLHHPPVIRVSEEDSGFYDLLRKNPPHSPRYAFIPQEFYGRIQAITRTIPFAGPQLINPFANKSAFQLDPYQGSQFLSTDLSLYKEIVNVVDEIDPKNGKKIRWKDYEIDSAEFNRRRAEYLYAHTDPRAHLLLIKLAAAQGALPHELGPLPFFGKSYRDHSTMNTFGFAKLPFAGKMETIYFESPLPASASREQLVEYLDYYSRNGGLAVTAKHSLNSDFAEKIPGDAYTPVITFNVYTYQNISKRDEIARHARREYFREAASRD